MKIDSMVKLVKFFNEKTNVNFVYFLNSNRKIIFTIEIKNPPKDILNIEKKMEEEIKSLISVEKPVKVLILTSTSYKLLNYIIKNGGMLLFCRNENVLMEWLEKNSLNKTQPFYLNFDLKLEHSLGVY